MAIGPAAARFPQPAHRSRRLARPYGERPWRGDHDLLGLQPGPSSQFRGRLYTSMWMTCTQRHRTCAHKVEMLWIPLPGRTHDKAFTCRHRQLRYRD